MEELCGPPADGEQVTDEEAKEEPGITSAMRNEERKKQLEGEAPTLIEKSTQVSEEMLQNCSESSDSSMNHSDDDYIPKSSEESSPDCSSEGLLVSEVSVIATAGHNVTLPCWYSVPLNGVRPFCWMRGDCPATTAFTFWCGSDEVYSDGDKVTRVSDKYQLTGDVQRGDLSLTVVNVSMEESGPYCCSVDIQGIFNDQMSSVLLTVTAGLTFHFFSICGCHTCCHSAPDVYNPRNSKE
ncbi:HAVR2 protein, partial [Polypterus senegalus]